MKPVKKALERNEMFLSEVQKLYLLKIQLARVRALVQLSGNEWVDILPK